MSEEAFNWMMLGMLLALVCDAIYPPHNRQHAVMTALVWALVIAGRYGLVAMGVIR